MGDPVQSLSKTVHPEVAGPKLQQNRPEYDEARTALETLHRELEDRNQSAAGSLAEGLDETLTLHRLGLYGVLGPVVEDDERSRVHQCARQGTLCEGRSLAALEPNATAGWRPRSSTSNRACGR